MEEVCCGEASQDKQGIEKEKGMSENEERDRRAMEEVKKYIQQVKKMRRDKAAYKRRLGLKPDPR
jgi:hypothetical protein